MQNRKDSLILKQKGNYIPLLKHGESVQVNEERGYCCLRTAKTGNLYLVRKSFNESTNSEMSIPICPLLETSWGRFRTGVYRF